MVRGDNGVGNGGGGLGEFGIRPGGGLGGSSGQCDEETVLTHAGHGTFASGA